MVSTDSLKWNIDLFQNNFPKLHKINLEFFAMLGGWASTKLSFVLLGLVSCHRKQNFNHNKTTVRDSCLTPTMFPSFESR